MGRAGIGAISQILSLRGWLKSSAGFDVAHAHSSKAGGVLRLALLGLDTPCVYTPHALITLNPDLGVVPRLAYGLVERLLATRSSKIICVSEQERKHAEHLGIPGAKLRVVYNGIAGVPLADRANARSTFGLADNEICIGTVARLAPQKAIDRLITAVGLIWHAQPNLRLVIVGEGPERSQLMQRVAELGMKNRVVFARSDQGSAAMAAFDVFAMTSIYESFPYVLLEAAWRGLPIVMADTGGAGVVVRDGDNGYVCRQNDLEFIAARLNELVRNRELRSRMGARSMELVTEFRVDPMVENTIAIYREAIRNSAQ
jgi:glycosyltransferase involved in cell wall biosynthesis